MNMRRARFAVMLMSASLTTGAVADNAEGNSFPATIAESQSIATDPTSHQEINIAENAPNKTIQGTSATGAKQMTIIDQNGNLKMVDKPAAGSNVPSTPPP